MRNFFKATCLMVMALLVINFTTNAQAFDVVTPTGPPCNVPFVPPGSVCVAEYTLNNMGQFIDGVWNWNQAFVDTVTPWLTHAIPRIFPGGAGRSDWLAYITPTMADQPPNVTSGRFERRTYAPGRDPEMRIAFQATSGADNIRFPKLMLGSCFKGGYPWEGGPMVNTDCSDSEALGANIYWGIMPPPNESAYPISNEMPVPAKMYTMADIESVRWVEKNLFATPALTDIQVYQSLGYNTFKRFWNPLGSTWQEPKDIHFNWRPIPALVENEVATFEIKMKDLTDPLLAKSMVRSLETMPSIPATIQVGSEKKGMKTVNNIVVREIDDPSGGKALVIQWPEPDHAMFGGVDFPPNSEYQVKVFVGAFGPCTWTNGWCAPAGGPGSDLTEVFLFIDVPAQMGTCVVEAPTYEALLAKMADKGFSASDLRAQIGYRASYYDFSFPDAFRLTFQNRGNSPNVPINEN